MSIFLSPLDVHRQYYPVNGVIESIVRDDTGQFNIANNLRKSRDNSKVIHVITDDASGEEVTVTQIAGMVARRISYRGSVGDHVSAGQELGIIHLGSRVDIKIPNSYHFLETLEVGEKIKGGELIALSSA